MISVTPRQRNLQKRRNRSILEEKESLTIALRGGTPTTEPVHEQNGEQNGESRINERIEERLDNESYHQHLDKQEQSPRELLDSELNNNHPLLNRPQTAPADPCRLTDPASDSSSGSTLTASGRLADGDNISLASTTSSLSTSSIATTDSSTLSDAAKRQSVSSLSDLEHLGE